MRAPRLHLPRPGRRRHIPAAEYPPDGPLPGGAAEYAPPVCGARCEGEDAPAAGRVDPCDLPAGHRPGYHRGTVTVNGTVYPHGWAWPARDGDGAT